MTVPHPHKEGEGQGVGASVEGRAMPQAARAAPADAAEPVPVSGKAGIPIAPGTPLPWEARRYTGGANSWFITTGDGAPSICGRGSAALSGDDARYIVHAANLYPELLAALEEAIATSDRLCAERGWVRAEEAETTLTKMRAAIARAKGSDQ